MAASWSIERSAAAISDIFDIADYLAGHDEAAAERFIHSLDRAFAQLSDYPRSGTLRQDLASELRSISLRPVVILYRLIEADRRVQIARVIDGRRDLGSLDLAG